MALPSSVPESIEDFVLDLLVIALTGVCANIDSITATRVNDLSPYGPTVLRSQGVGLTPEQFHAGLRAGTVVGHIGFQESIHLIARAVGWEVTRVTETREPIIARTTRQTRFVHVAPGEVAGCLHKAVAHRNDKAVITLIHPQQVQPEHDGIETADTIEIHGEPHVRLAGSPEIPGGTATIALAVNMIPHVLNASPGIHTMADLPVPAAMLVTYSVLFGSPSQRGNLWLSPSREAPGLRSTRWCWPQMSAPTTSRKTPSACRWRCGAKGFLFTAAALGDQVEIVTVTGRRVHGTLAQANPSYGHGFGAPITELQTIGGEVRAWLRAARGIK